jgi:hypothetical protein
LRYSLPNKNARMDLTPPRLSGQCRAGRKRGEGAVCGGDVGGVDGERLCGSGYVGIGSRFHRGPDSHPVPAFPILPPDRTSRRHGKSTRMTQPGHALCVYMTNGDGTCSCGKRVRRSTCEDRSELGFCKKRTRQRTRRRAMFPGRMRRGVVAWTRA